MMKTNHYVVSKLKTSFSASQSFLKLAIQSGLLVNLNSEADPGVRSKNLQQKSLHSR